MRVIAGKARSLHLKTIEGLDTRPTTDRIKETLFNMINDELYGASFLVLFSGSGGIGIEALSRGARKAVFVESSRKAAACIQENLKFTRLASDGEVLVMDVFRALDLLAVRGESFSVIFMDPPYDQELEKQVLKYLAGSSLVYEDTVIIVEASLNTDFSYIGELGFSLIKEKRYKTNKHVFLEKAGKEEIC